MDVSAKATHDAHFYAKREKAAQKDAEEEFQPNSKGEEVKHGKKK